MSLNKTLLAACLGLLCATLSPAQAAMQTYNFSGTLDSGSLSGMPFGGMLSFDDAALTGVGTEWIGVSTLLTFLPAPALFTAADADVPAEVGFENGVFLGLSASFSGIDSQFTFVAGYLDSSDAFLAYDTAAGISGAGSMIYAPVPEPESWAMLLMGLGLVSLRLRSKSQSVACHPNQG